LSHEGRDLEEEKLDAASGTHRYSRRYGREAKEYREKLLEGRRRLDDEVLAAYLDGNEPDEPTLKRMSARPC